MRQHGVQSVMMSGTAQTALWLVGNSDSTMWEIRRLSSRVERETSLSGLMGWVAVGVKPS